ncbi:MAG TPA: methylamine utilization protein [Geothrix sp.]|nr:methylamine utilization protein [Geothrix sp.]
MSIRPAALLLWILMGPAPALLLAGDLAAEVRDRAGKPVADAVILAVPTDGHAIRPQAHPRQEVDQVNLEFTPYVKVVPMGSEVYFPNKDNVRHQVYSFSPAKRFELPLYSGRSAPPVRFEKPGVVVLGCNIHDWMQAYVYVTDAPFYGQTGKDGKALLPNLPAGEYQIRVWHPRLKDPEQATLQRATLPASGTLALHWDLTVGPDHRPRRRPDTGGSGYR